MNENNEHLLVQDETLKLPRSVRLNPPWLSLIASLMLVVFFAFQFMPQLQEYYQFYTPTLNIQSVIMLISILGCIFLLDIHLFFRRKKRV